MERLPTPERPNESAPESAFTATATIDEQGIVTGWSEGAWRLLGYAASEAVGRPAAGLLADDAREAIRRPPSARDRWNGTLALRHRDGHRLELRLLAHRRTNQGITEWHVVSAVAAEQCPPGGEPLREWAFSQSPDILAIFDTDLRLVAANVSMERALSLAEAEMRGLHLPEIAPRALSYEAERSMRLALSTGEQQYVAAYICSEGVSLERGWPTSLAPLKDSDGRVRAVCLTAHSRPEGHHARQRTLLKEAGARIEPTSDIARTSQELADVAIPWVADHAAVDLDDLLLAQELTARAAASIHDAQRNTPERTSTITLQRSLLPHALPGQAAVEIASRYLPTGTTAGVGGDWFDVIPLSGARVGLVVGDVVGHGIRASATMGRLRTAVRTLADIDLPPDELLTHLDDLVIHLAADEGEPSAETAAGIGTTCLYAVYDPVSRRCTVARAGHPPPAAVTPDGAVYFLDVPPGPPLGLGGLPFEMSEIELPESSILALYTDGLLEARDHDIDEALDRIFAALSSPAPTLDTVCDTILAPVLSHSPDDDIALLVARTRAMSADQVATWDLAFDPAIVSQAREHAADQLTAWGLVDTVFITELIVSELVTNAIRYGRPPIQLRLIHKDNTLISEVFDSSSTSPHLRRARTFDEGGRGLLLVAQLSERWGTRHATNGKTIWAEQPLSTVSGT